MNVFLRYLIILIAISGMGCRSFVMSDGGRVEHSFNTYYINDKLQVGAKLYGDMFPEFKDGKQGGPSVKLTREEKAVLRLFRINKADTILFISRHDSTTAFGLIRPPHKIKLQEYKSIVDKKCFYLLKPIKVKDHFLHEGLIRLNSDRYLSIIFDSTLSYSHLEHNTVMVESAQRVKEGEMMKPVLNPFTEAETLFEDHGYLAPFELSKTIESYKERSTIEQPLATLYSFCGHMDLAKQSEKQFIGFKQYSIDPADLSTASTFILNRTKHEKVVMFNCAHHRPEHPYFMGQILDSLYKQGFTYLAMEALSDSTAITKDSLVNLESGYYTRDPVLSNFIRKAISLGFKIISYDDAEGNRELIQAKNIIRQTINVDSSSKVLVLGGYGHIDETSSPKKMAAHFKDLTGINPLTIDQTTLMTSTTKDAKYESSNEVFVYKKDLNPTIDILVWNNIDLQKLAIGFPSKDETVETTIDFTDSLSIKDQISALLIYKASEYKKDTTVTPVYVKVFPDRAVPVHLKIKTGTYLIQYTTYKKQVLYQKELIL